MTSQTLVEQFRQDIGDVSSTVDERQLRQKSHDFHWYSPVLTPQLQDCLADVLVQLRSEEEIAAVVVAAVKHRIPLTVRGGGTGNYGQSVPLKGGVLVDMTGFNKVTAVESGSIRVQAGAVIGAALEAALASGQQLMMIVQTDDLWITANFKETQLARMHPGQLVEVAVDALHEKLSGTVESMPAVTGSRTSVLPPENATGNYVKVIQRMPVRIRLNPGQKDLGKLRPGMSVEPKVYVE